MHAVNFNPACLKFSNTSVAIVKDGKANRHVSPPF